MTQHDNRITEKHGGNVRAHGMGDKPKKTAALRMMKKEDAE